MKLTNQFVSTETNKTAATVVKLSEHLLGHGHIVWMGNFYNSPQVAWFMKYKIKQAVLELYVLTGRMLLL
jgi:hypothetical protein